MKRRPRRIESEVAKHISLFSSQYGLSPVERIPVLGRTGPDLAINELGLVVDVKSRLSVPKGWLLPAGFVAIDMNGRIAMRLSEIASYRNTTKVLFIDPSVLVSRWLEHMDEWTQQQYPDGISALVLHRPGLPVGNSTLVIYEKDRRKLYDRYQRDHSISTGQ